MILTIAPRFDAEDVADSIRAGLKGAATKVADQQVTVSNAPIDRIMAALAKIDVAPPLDDVDSMLKELQAGADSDEGTGSSIRATKAMSLADLLGPAPKRLYATVLAVQRGQYPLVLVTVRVEQAPENAAVAAGDKLTVIPQVRVKDRQVEDDPLSSLNIRAWYAQQGDAVELKLGERRATRRSYPDIWSAKAYRRKDASMQ
ncbi:MAG: hypothetical protein AAGK78_09465 [Planctomycetota bacterium]